MPSSGQRTGIANLPLHHGKVPPWLFGRMCQLVREITVVKVTEYGHPYPMDKTTYDSSIQFLAQAVEKAKMGDREKLEAFKRLRALQ